MNKYTIKESELKDLINRKGRTNEFNIFSRINEDFYNSVKDIKWFNLGLGMKLKYNLIHRG